MIATPALFGVLLLLAPTPSATHAPAVAPGSGIPEDGSRVVFIGDSITQAGQYVVNIEAFLLTRFPDRTITVISHGLSSETAAGTSEPDHPFPRPCIHDRFERDVTAWRPDRVVACYGMNDGIYHPFDPELFSRYQDGILRLIERTRTEADARIDLLTPPPFDAYRRRAGDPEAIHFGYRYPAVDYDAVLARYGEWLRSLQADDLLVADVHGAINAHLERRRADRASFSVSPDAVHPDATGHWLIAQALLLAWDAPADVAEAHVDAIASRPVSGAVRDVTSQDGFLTFSWTSPLPMPIDPACDPESLLLEQVSDRLNRYRLTVTGLDPGSYRLLASAEGAESILAGTFSAEALASGIDLTALPDFPTVSASRDVLRLLTDLRTAQSHAWRSSLRGEPIADAPPPPGEDDALMAPIRVLCQPHEIQVRIEPMLDRVP